MEKKVTGGCWIKGIVVFFVLMSLAAIVGGIYLFTKNVNLKFSGVKTQGVFMYYERSESQQTNRDQARYNQVDVYYYPVFRYAVNGDSITAKVNAGSEDASFYPGDLAEIVYSPSDPSFIGFPESVNKGMLVALLCTGLGSVILFLVIYLVKNFDRLKVDSETQDAH